MSKFNESKYFTVKSEENIQINGADVSVKEVRVKTTPQKLIELIGEEEVIAGLDLSEIARVRGKELEKHYGSANPVVVGSTPYEAAQREARTASVSKSNLKEEQDLRKTAGNREDGAVTGPATPNYPGNLSKEVEASGEVERTTSPGTVSSQGTSTASPATGSTSSPAIAKPGTATVLPPAGIPTAVGPTNPTVTKPDQKSPAVVVPTSGTNTPTGSTVTK